MSFARKRALLWNPVELVQSAAYREERKRQEFDWIAFLHDTGLIERAEFERAKNRLERFFAGMERKLR